MKIEYGNIKAQSLSSIEVGDVFEYNNTLYLKTDEYVDNSRTCVRLGDGHIVAFLDECFIYKHEAKVVIE